MQPREDQQRGRDQVGVNGREPRHLPQRAELVPRRALPREDLECPHQDEIAGAGEETTGDRVRQQARDAAPSERAQEEHHHAGQHGRERQHQEHRGRDAFARQEARRAGTGQAGGHHGEDRGRIRVRPRDGEWQRAGQRDDERLNGCGDQGRVEPRCEERLQGRSAPDQRGVAERVGEGDERGDAAGRDVSREPGDRHASTRTTTTAAGSGLDDP